MVSYVIKFTQQSYPKIFLQHGLLPYLKEDNLLPYYKVSQVSSDVPYRFYIACHKHFPVIIQIKSYLSRYRILIYVNVTDNCALTNMILLHQNWRGSSLIALETSICPIYQHLMTYRGLLDLTQFALNCYQVLNYHWTH